MKDDDDLKIFCSNNNLGYCIYAGMFGG